MTPCIHISFTEFYGAEYGADETVMSVARPTSGSGATFVGVDTAEQYVDQRLLSGEYGITAYTNMEGWLQQL